MKNKWITNKVTIIVALILCVIAFIGIGAILAPSFKNGNNSGIESEKVKDDETTSEDEKKEESNKGLDVQDAYDNNTQDKSDASGNWGDDTNSNPPPQNVTNGNQEEQNKNNNSNDGDQEEEILKDDIDWGEIY